MIFELIMEFFTGGLVGVVSFLWVNKKTKGIRLTVGPYVGLPFIRSGVPRNALKSRFVRCWLSSVLHVLKTAGQAQVNNSVVVANSIDVINFKRRPLSMGHRPSHSVSAQQFIVYSDNDVSRSIQARDQSACFAFSTIDAPSQLARFRAVVEKFAKAIRCWFHNNMVTSSTLFRKY